MRMLPTGEVTPVPLVARQQARDSSAGSAEARRRVTVSAGDVPSSDHGTAPAAHSASSR